MDMTVVFGLHKFRLQGTIDHHGPSMYSSHYTASNNYCKKHSIATTSKLRSYLLLIWLRINWLHNGFRTRTGGLEFCLLPWRWHILSIPLKAGRGISAETCGLDNVFPPDDLGSGPCTSFIIYIHYSCIICNQNKLFLKDIHTKRLCGHARVLDDLILSLFPD